MKKSQQILVLNTFAIIMVCIGHSFTAVESYYGHKWIYSFHMPLFMFISGYLLNYATMHKQQEISDISLLGKQGYIVKRAIRLLVPYFIISSITYIPKVLLSAHALRPIDFSIHSYIHMLLYPMDNVIKFFWFLPTLFIVSIITIILYKANKFLMKKYALDWRLWAIISTVFQIYIPFYIYKGIIYIKNNKRYGKTIATLLGQ